ncbi:dicarboxylate/amino acid:cation symporter [Bariatricus sp. HCP28S3_C2]|uniref:dicarboxylate/amino acid:cation symporter n=1 Tax=unclassified Bariatricus TaxID=2677046 RepID=UPI003F88F202
MPKRFELSEKGIMEALEFLGAELPRKKVSEKDIIKTRLLAEECLFKLAKDAAEGTTFEIWICSVLGNVTTKIKCKGKEIDFSDALALSGNDFKNAFDEEMDDSAIETIQNMLLKGFADKFKISRKKNMNYIDIITKKDPQMTLYITLSAIVLAVIIGLFMCLCLSETIYNGFCNNVLQPLKTIYMNLLSMIVGPVVFFSMITCMMQFSDMRSFGRIGGKTMGIYTFTSAIAAIAGIGIFYLIQPGTEGSFVSMITSQDTPNTAISFLDTIIDIFPSNIVGSFYENNVLQILLMGLFMGVAANLIGEKGKVLQNFFEAMNDMFLEMVLLLAKLIPLITFCSVMILILTTGTDALISLLALIGTLLAGLVVMVFTYSIMIVLTAKVSPFPFLKRYIPTALNVFSLSSSSASMPLNMDFCKNIGISQRVYSFTIPFGATINMDGAMIALMTGVLFMAKTFGVTIDTSHIIMLIVSGMLLSMASPGVPGGSLVACTVLLKQMGVPMDCLPLVMVYLTVTDMICTVSNTTGDVAASVIVASTEKLLDKNKYYQKN